MEILRFRYRNAAGEVSEKAISKWKEPGIHIEGLCADKGMDR